MRLITILLTLLLGLSACTRQQPRYVIGVSQCSADIWREKQNAELRMASYFQKDVQLRFAAAYDSDERQVVQIDSLVASGIDLLIVAPNQVQTITPAIDRAFDKGIPVIVFERKTNSQKYTAFISADNYEMGRTMGEYIADQLDGKGRVLEVMGLKGSSPAIERHQGFADVLSHYPGIQLVATLQGDWTEESAAKAVGDYQGDLSQIDFVFGQNDRMAMGARRAFTLHSSLSALPRFCGIDGLPGHDGGIRLVRDSILSASYIYPTHGDRLLQVALDILDGKAFDKETKLMAALVTDDNADVLLMQSDEMMRQTAWLDQLHAKADDYLQQLDTQRTITLLAIVTIALLLTTLVFFYRYYIGKLTLRQERVVSTLWSLDSDAASVPGDSAAGVSADTPAASADADAPADAASPAQPEPEPQPTSVFISRFKEAVEARLADSDITVEDLAADMNISRVQLYRKVKQLTGSSPVELLRTARLKRGYQLLLTTDLTVSEVAYQTGFTAPSYFTKCFKDEFGQLPGDVRSA